MDDMEQKIIWLIKHLSYTQALCEILIENIPDTDKSKLLDLVKDRVKEIY